MLPTPPRRLVSPTLGVLLALAVLASGDLAQATWPDLSRIGEPPYDTAQRYFKVKEHDTALGYLDRALEAAPDDLAARFLRAECYRETWQLERAMADYNEVLRRNPGHAEAYLGRGIVNEYRGYWDTAIADYDRAIRRDPKLALPHVYRGALWFKRGKTQQATADLNRAIQLSTGQINADPRDLVAYRIRALAYSSMNQYDKAIEDYGRMIEIDPGSIEAYLERGRTYAQREEKVASVADLDEAVRLATEMLRRQPPNPRAFRLRIKAHDARAFAWKDPEDFRRAVADCDKLLEITPECAAVYFRRGHLRAGASHFSGDPQDGVLLFDRAEADLSHVLQIDKTYAAAWHERGLLYLRAAMSRRQPTLALRGVTDLTEMIRLVPQSALAHCARGSAYGLAGNYQKALDDFNQAVRLCPEMADAYALRGGVNMALGKDKQAQADMARANELRTKTR